ncbi:TPA_asm: hypothetical protein GEG28_14570 [Listeria monocytogenes]|nr:hypothetical protein [Listeria monocytogenes]
MRGIEFRGKIVGAEGFVYGKLLAPLASGNAYIAYDVNEVGSFVYISRSEKVDPETVGQYTGLKDKNGKKIFEGDIVINSKGQIGYIAFLIQEAGFVVVLKNSDYRLGHRNTNECYERATHHKIIGNIHENPELLEVAE